MTEFEKLVIKLINAINDEDLETTKACVDALNQLEYSNRVITSMLRFNFDYQNYTNYFNNKCIDYVLKNLHGIQEADLTLFEKEKNRLAFNREIPAIQEFIESQLKEKTYNVSDQKLVQSLIELSVQLNDRQKTAEMLNKILEKYGSIE